MDISEILKACGPHLTESDGWVVPCPAHNDTQQSLRVAITEDDTVLLHCRAGCNKQDVLNALEDVGVPRRELFNVGMDLSLPQTVTAAANSAGPTPAMVAGIRLYSMTAADQFTGSDAEQYAMQRFGLDQTDALQLGLGFDDGSAGFDAEWRTAAFARVPRLTVPFRDMAGTIKALQGRALADDRVRWCGFRNADDGTAWAKYGYFSSGTGSAYTVICEGPSDALTAVAAGFDAIAIRGAALGPVAADLVAPLTGQTVVVAGDNDRAGDVFTEAVLDALEGADVRRLVLPDDIEDLNDLYQSTGRLDAVADLVLNAAVPFAEGLAGAPPIEPPADDEVPEDIENPDYPLADLGMALRLRDSFDGNVKFTIEAGFFIYNGVTWEQDILGVVRSRHHDLLLDLEAHAEAALAAARAADDGTDREARALLQHVRSSMTSRGINAALGELKVMPTVACSFADFDAHAELLAFKNGVVNLRTGELEPAHRDLMLTRQLDFDYDPNAECPHWHSFLTDVFPNDADMPAYLQRLIGYGISGSSEEQCFVVLHGTGANGKSAFTETLTEIFDPITNTTPFSTFEAKPSGGIPNDLAALKGARLVMASEGDANKPMAEGLLKRVTGRDQITARFMRQEFFSYRPTFLLMLASNHRPRFIGQDDGLWRRVKLISWERYFAPHERDHGIWQRLLSERQGIARWAVEGAKQYFAPDASGKNTGLQDPPSLIAATANYKANADALAGFFPGRLVKDADHNETAQDVFTSYVEHCEAEHLPLKERWTRRAFYSALEERGVQRGTTKKGVQLRGVRLVKDAVDLNPISRP